MLPGTTGPGCWLGVIPTAASVVGGLVWLRLVWFYLGPIVFLLPSSWPREFPPGEPADGKKNDRQMEVILQVSDKSRPNSAKGRPFRNHMEISINFSARRIFAYMSEAFNTVQSSSSCEMLQEVTQRCLHSRPHLLRRSSNLFTHTSRLPNQRRPLAPPRHQSVLLVAPGVCWK